MSFNFKLRWCARSPQTILEIKNDLLGLNRAVITSVAKFIDKKAFDAGPAFDVTYRFKSDRSREVRYLPDFLAVMRAIEYYQSRIKCKICFSYPKSNSNACVACGMVKNWPHTILKIKKRKVPQIFCFFSLVWGDLEVTRGVRNLGTKIGYLIFDFALTTQYMPLHTTKLDKIVKFRIGNIWLHAHTHTHFHTYTCPSVRTFWLCTY